jgi:hypothetical protein
MEVSEQSEVTPAGSKPLWGRGREVAHFPWDVASNHVECTSGDTAVWQ